MSGSVKHPIEVAWHCMNCGARGITWSHTKEGLRRRLWVHHKAKSPACRYHHDDILLGRPSLRRAA